ncbi:unnamed protein product, partial [Ilex paraguariensis]
MPLPLSEKEMQALTEEGDWAREGELPREVGAAGFRRAGVSVISGLAAKEVQVSGRVAHTVDVQDRTAQCKAAAEHWVQAAILVSQATQSDGGTNQVVQTSGRR